MTLSVPAAGPWGFTRGRAASWSVVHQSVHHSHTLPAMFHRPNRLGAKASMGAVPRYPSSAVFFAGKCPRQMLQRKAPSGFNSSPHG